MMVLISIIINASFFLLLLTLLASLFLSAILYKKQTVLLNIPKYLLIVLFFLRFFSFFLLFLLLLEPELKGNEKVIEKPLIVFLQDNTTSIISNHDSLYYQNHYLKKIDSLKALNNINIDFILFDDNIEKKIIDFTGSTTNISSVLEQVSNIYSNTYVSAYILASDGIFNQGLNPIYKDNYFNAPLYTVQLGDTIEYQDALVKSIINNKITYLGNETPVEIVVEAKGMINKELILDVYNDEKQSIYHQNIVVNDSYYVDNFQFFISPEEPGIKNYHVSLQSNEIEKNTFNNEKDFFIDVIDDRKRILLLFSHHHPDIAAIQESLASHDQYEVHSHWLSDLNPKQFNYTENNGYSLIIAHQLSTESEFNKLKYYNKVPILHIIGSRSNLNTFNQFQDFIKFKNIDKSFEYSNVSLNTTFSSFLINDSLSNFLSLSTPFLTPFSEIESNSFVDVLLYKKIGSLNTERPVLFFTENNYKAGFLLGEGLWRWRLNDTYLNNSNSLFNHFLSQVTQYLLLDEDKDRFHVNFDPVYQSSQRVIFEAELYNKNFESITSIDIEMQLTDSLGVNYQYQFIVVDNKYHLDVSLPDGKYEFIATADFNNELFVKKGKIIISNFDIESRDLVAKDNLLLDLALQNNGHMITKDSLTQLIDGIISLPTFKPRAYFNYYYQSLINFQSLLVLILCTLFIEWFLRRRYINY
ncbi:MAG: hypothetical protein CMP50_00175 [Flavobacteriales bacterium]|nr:hypothetical protein [Flavobacteriales bacterium]